MKTHTRRLLLFVLGLWFGLSAVSAATLNVTGSGTSFSPSRLTVTNGDTVVWSLSGSHTVSPRGVTPEPFCGPNGVPSCTVTFNSVGAFPYQCNFHAGFNMTGLVTVVAAPVAPPTVSITNPPINALYAAPGIVAVGVSVTNDGSVVNVRLLTNGVFAATNTIAPFGFTLSNLVAGNYVLRARVENNQALSSTSLPVNIRVVTRPLLNFERGTNGPFQFQFNSATGVNYVVEGSTALTNFSSIVTNAGSGGAIKFSQTNPAPSQRFFRLRLE
jgi:plastocyanin